MNIADIQALAFDTGGTILDWHTGFVGALRAAGEKHGESRDWHAMAVSIKRSVPRMFTSANFTTSPSAP